MGDILKMSQKELYRIEVIMALDARKIKYTEGSKRLKLSVRQTKRLLKNYRKEGANGLLSKKRGKPSNRRYDDKLRGEVKSLIETKYKKFGPTLAAEKLREEDGIALDNETLRRFMIGWGLWRSKPRKSISIHQQRPRRERFGELVQIDGSHHDWFEGRGSKCCLIVFVDDATSRILEMSFSPTETMQSYFGCVRRYIKKYGRPMAFYSDRHGIFRVNQGSAKGGETQFSRAMKELEIEIICANSPQAKGRVERANRTLQDRLVKEMRLRGIADIVAANEYIKGFVEDYNRRFGKNAVCEFDAHSKTLPEDLVLDAILCERDYRKLSHNLEFQFERKVYQIINHDKHNLRRANITICRGPDNEIKVWYQNMFLECREFKQKQAAIITSSRQEANALVDGLCVKSVSETGTEHAWMDVPFLRLVSCDKDRQISQ